MELLLITALFIQPLFVICSIVPTTKSAIVARNAVAKKRNEHVKNAVHVIQVSLPAFIICNL